MRRGRRKPAHEHEFKIDAVVSGKMVIPVLGATPNDATWVLYRCACDAPGGLMSVNLGGRWTIEQLKGGEAPVIELAIVPAATGEPDPAS